MRCQRASRRASQQRACELDGQRVRGEAHGLAHPAAGHEARAKAAAVVGREHARVSAIEICRRHLRGKGGEAQRRVEAARGERRDRAGGVADEQPALAGDAAQDSADRNQPAAPLHRPPSRHARAEPPQRLRRVEAIGVARHPDVLFLPVVDHPPDVAGRQPRIEVAVHGRRGAGQHVFDADQKLRVAIELQLARHQRPRPVRADDEARGDAPHPPAPRHDCVGSFHAQQTRRRHPHHARARALFEQPEVDPRHAPDAELVARRGQGQRTAGGGVEHDLADRAAELLGRKGEVLPRLADEDAGGVHAVRERGFAVGEGDAEAAKGEEARHLESRQAGAGDEDIEHDKHFTTQRTFPPDANRPGTHHAPVQTLGGAPCPARSPRPTPAAASTEMGWVDEGLRPGDVRRDARLGAGGVRAAVTKCGVPECRVLSRIAW